jgi:hypothetical protein
VDRRQSPMTPHKITPPSIGARRVAPSGVLRPRSNVQREIVADIHAQMNELAPRTPWSQFKREFWTWQQGQHVAAIGPTESGKTSLVLALLSDRKYVTAFGTKPRDLVLDEFAKKHKYKYMSEWDSLDAVKYPRRMLWPDARDLYSVTNQKKQFRLAFDRIYREGNWTLYLDELWFIAKMLKLEYEVKMYLLQARSNGISLVVATQRPAWVPLEVYDGSTWLFFWRDNDETNLKRISGISWLSKNLVQMIVARLERYEALAINTRTGKMVRTMAPDPGVPRVAGRQN